MELKIDAEFHALIPSLKEDEYAGLKQSLINEGCRDSLVTWVDPEEGDEILLDGHNRYEICTKMQIPFKTIIIELPNRDDAKIWIIRNQFSRRNLSTFQRTELGLKLEPLIAAKAEKNLHLSEGKGLQKSAKVKPIDTRAEIAAAAGVSHDTVHKVKTILENGTPEIIDRARTKDISINEAYKQVKKETRKAKVKIQRDKLIEKSMSANKDDRWSVETSDISTYQTDKKYDFIITDPPYLKEYLELYEVLAVRSEEWLKEGGLLIAMCGQLYLNQIYASMSVHLDYYWTSAYLLPGQPTPLRTRQVNACWKPLLMFVKKDDTYKGKIFGDVFKSDIGDKNLHEWGQSESGMYDIIKSICLPGQSIFDPFLGSGTTGAAALKHGCFFDGIDIDESCVLMSRGRLNDKAEN